MSDHDEVGASKEVRGSAGGSVTFTSSVSAFVVRTFPAFASSLSLVLEDLRTVIFEVVDDVTVAAAS